MDAGAVSTAVSFISGGLAGAVVNSLVGQIWQRRALALKLVDRYFDTYSELAAIKTLLANPSLLSDAAQRNRVRAIGDWFEIAASLYNRGKVDRALLDDLGLDTEIIDFRTKAEQSRACDDELKIWTALKSFPIRARFHSFFSCEGR